MITGLHHITLVSINAKRTADFYTGVLGLRLIKKTINFDDPSAYHLYFGDQLGRPGSAITFFEWPHAGSGHPGIGGTHHLALQVPSYDVLLMWKRRLTDLGIPVDGPFDRNYFKSIYFRDPDGVILELATVGPGWTIDEAPDQLGQTLMPPPEAMLVANRDETTIQQTTWPEPVPGITPAMLLNDGMHHITAISSNIRRTHDFLGGLLGLRLLKMTSNFDDPNSAHWYWGVGEGKPGTIITYFERDPKQSRPVQMGGGQTHHWALSVPDAETQLEWREKLVKAGLNVSPVMERIYFKSIYTRDPDGHIVEIATATPGFAVDEPLDHLGEALKLPPWLESMRARIEGGLQPI